MDFSVFKSKVECLQEEYATLELYGFSGDDCSAIPEIIEGLEISRRLGKVDSKCMEDLLTIMWMVSEFIEERDFLRKIWWQRLTFLFLVGIVGRISLIALNPDMFFPLIDKTCLLLGGVAFVLLFIGGRRIGTASWFFEKGLTTLGKGWWTNILGLRDGIHPFSKNLNKLRNAEMRLGVSTIHKQRSLLLSWAALRCSNDLRKIKKQTDLMAAYELGLMIPMVLLILAGPLCNYIQLG
jgi:hypothetical protein